MNFTNPLPRFLFHVAYADDWEACARFGEYDVATKGTPFEALGRIQLCTAEHIGEVRQRHYSDTSVPLLLIALRTETLAAEGISVTADPEPGILQELPMDSAAIIAVIPLAPEGELPDLSPLG